MGPRLKRGGGDRARPCAPPQRNIILALSPARIQVPPARAPGVQREGGRETRAAKEEGEMGESERGKVRR